MFALLNDARFPAFIFLMRSNHLPRSPQKNPYFPGRCGLAGDCPVTKAVGLTPVPACAIPGLGACREQPTHASLSRCCFSLSKNLNKMSLSEDFLKSICSQTSKTIID